MTFLNADFDRWPNHSNLAALSAGNLGTDVGGIGQRLSIRASLAGVLKISTEHGVQIPLTGIKRKRLFAILLRAPRMQCTNVDLENYLCGGLDDPQASLRQHRHHLRKALLPFGGDVIAIDGVTRLVGVTDNTECEADPDTGFFKDRGDLVDDEDFEDWFRQERSEFENATPSVATPMTHLNQGRVKLGMISPVVSGTDLQGAVITDWVSNCLRDIFVGNQFLDFADLRRNPEDVVEMDFWIEVRVVQINTIAEISVGAFSTANKRCLFSRSVSCVADQSFSLEREELATFIAISVSAIERAVSQSSRSSLMAWNEAPLYEIVSRMFRLEPRSVLNAIEALAVYESDHNPASVLSWRAFANMLLNGERLVANPQSALAEAEEQIYCALELDPTNPTALAVAAHYHAFVSGDFEISDRLSKDALAIAPYSPFSRDVRAMFELYTGNHEHGYEQAKFASRLGQASPLGHYVDASLVVGATLTGNHEEAIRHGREILARRPSFLPVMRHMTASYASLGRIEDMTKLVEKIRHLDPKFGTPEMLSPNYGLPSERSRSLITAALRNNQLFKE
jgi:tetratricopeptide (TPR) repeat protein